MYQVPPGSIIRQPSQTLKEFTEDDYMNNARFVASNWNKVVYNFTPEGRGATATPKFWVIDYLQNASYWFGKNVDTDYAFATKDELNNVIPVPMFRGQDIQALIKHTIGVISELIAQVPDIISVRTMSSDLISKKKLLRDLALFNIRNKTFADYVKEITGLEVQPIKDMDFNNVAEVEAYFADYKDALETLYITLARYSFQFNYGNEFFEKQAAYYGIGGVIGCRVYAQNGKPKWRLIEPQNLIWDNYQSQDQHRNDRFSGEYFERTIPELLTMFKWTPEERKDVEAMADAGNTIWATYNVPMGNNLIWWRSTAVGIPMVAVVHAEWRSLKFEGVDKNGDEIWSPCLRQAWLIGNKYVKEYGESPNQMFDKTDDSSQRSCYIVASADTVMGVSMGIAGRLKEYQKLKDYFQTKLNQLVYNSKGKRYVMYSDAMPEGMRSPDILAQLTQAGMVILPSRDMDDPQGNGKLIETIDMTLDPSIVGLSQLIDRLRVYMDDIISMPANSRGMVSSYQSKDTLRMNLESASKGMASYYSTFYTWALRLLEYSTDLAKTIMGESDEDTMSLLVGDAMVEYVETKDIKDMQMKDFAMSLGLQDFLNDQERAMFVQYYMQRASATNDPEDELVFANIARIKTKTEMYNYIESVVSKKIDRKQQELMAQQSQQMAMAEQAANAQVESAQIGQETALEGQAMKQEGDVDKMILQKQLEQEMQ
jgi:hypothetical protein